MVEQINFTDDFRAALRAGVPLIAVQTPDPASIIKQVLAITKEKTKNAANENAPVVVWDLASGLKGWNETGMAAITTAISTFCPNKKPYEITDPFASIMLFEYFPERTIIIMLNAHRLIGAVDVQQMKIGQAIWNLRDKYKSSKRVLVITAPMIKLPPELVNDVLVLDEPFPEKAELEDIVKKLHEGVKLAEPSPQVLDKAVEATKGLSLFKAEQAVALSFSKAEGFSLPKLWRMKQKLIENTVGLSVYKGAETFTDVKGVTSIKSYLTKLMHGKEPPTVIVFLDELEKMFGGISGDLSGASQEQLGEFLRWTQDNHVLALMEIGHPGCTKSFLAKATAGEFQLPMVELNISALKGMLQGQTGQQTRMAFKTISAIGRPLIMATSNSMTIFPPELKRRFKQGIWVFDLPSMETKQTAWDLYIKKFKLSNKQAFTIPNDTNWTLSEIEVCCENAWRLDISLEQAKEYVVPIYRADPAKVEKLRADTAGKFLSADYEGIYVGSNKIEEESKRKMTAIGEA